MHVGTLESLNRKRLSGWAMDPSRPDEIVTVAIDVNGRRVAELAADAPLDPQAARAPEAASGHGFSFQFATLLARDAAHEVIVQTIPNGIILQNGRRTLRAQVSPAPQPSMPGAPARAVAGITPILVTAPGRSGTTLLMNVLAQSPGIVVAELVPFEVRLLSYYASVYNVLTSGADLERSTHPDRLQGDGFHVGFNPFTDKQYAQAFKDQEHLQTYHQAFIPERVAALTRDLVAEYYTRLGRDKAKPAARYFAEKNNNLHRPTRLFTRAAFAEVHEIVLVRDPRDILCSHMAYFASSPEKAFTQLTHAGRQILAIKAEARNDVLFLRYEDLVAQRAECYEQLAAFLSVPIAKPDSGSSEKVFAVHATSASPADSVERWRTTLPAELAARCATEWANFLEKFGYSTT